MTDLPRITISFPPDIQAAIDEIKSQDEFKRVPKSKIVCALIRRGIGKSDSDTESETKGGATHE